MRRLLPFALVLLVSTLAFGLLRADQIVQAPPLPPRDPVPPSPG